MNTDLKWSTSKKEKKILKERKKGKKSPGKRQGKGKEREGNGETGEILGVKEMS